MAAVPVRIPRMLRQLIGRSEPTVVEAATMDGAVRALIEAHPALGVHLLDEQGVLREHVIVLLGEQMVPWDEAGSRRLSEGDEVTVLQAVSGGAQG